MPYRKVQKRNEICKTIQVNHPLLSKSSNQKNPTPDSKKKNTWWSTTPEKLTIHQLKHLTPLGLRHHSKIFSLAYPHARFPDIWKRVVIVTLLKAGKPKEQATSHLPISLLCPASKLFEWLMIRFIIAHIHLADTQQGFRSRRFNTTALLSLAQ